LQGIYILFHLARLLLKLGPATVFPPMNEPKLTKNGKEVSTKKQISCLYLKGINDRKSLALLI
jgi:hypothetical protein